jgi:hypothetical protein
MATTADFDSLTDALNEASVGMLGDTITYTPMGGAAKTIKAFVDDYEAINDFGQSSAIAAEVTMQILITDVPVRPARDDRIMVKTSGRTYSPLAARLGRDGRFWHVDCKPVLT